MKKTPPPKFLRLFILRLKLSYWLWKFDQANTFAETFRAGAQLERTEEKLYVLKQEKTGDRGFILAVWSGVFLFGGAFWYFILSLFNAQ